MKIIFLDIDGVLNSETWLPMCDPERPLSFFEPTCVDHLNSIVEETSAKVVISSAWRYRHNISEIKYFLKCVGAKVEVIGQTTPSSRRMARRHKIKEWLKFNKGVESYVILEDEHPMGDLEPHTVRTDPYWGLLRTDALEAIKILNRGKA